MTDRSIKALQYRALDAGADHHTLHEHRRRLSQARSRQRFSLRSVRSQCRTILKELEVAEQAARISALIEHYHDLSKMGVISPKELIAVLEQATPYIHKIDLALENALTSAGSWRKWDAQLQLPTRIRVPVA
jgi:hypothetical protein